MKSSRFLLLAAVYLFLAIFHSTHLVCAATSAHIKIFPFTNDFTMTGPEGEWVSLPFSVVQDGTYQFSVTKSGPAALWNVLIDGESYPQLTNIPLTIDGENRIPQTLFLETGQHSIIFQAAGSLPSEHTWKIVSVDEEGLEIQGEPVYQSLAAVPSWEGETIPVPFEVAQEVGRIRRIIAQNTSEGFGFEFLRRYPIDDESIRKVYDFISRHSNVGFSIPTDRKIVIECLHNYSIIHACFGSLVNNTLAMIIAAVLTSKLGVNVATQVDPYRIALITPIKLRASRLKRELMKLRERISNPY